MAVLIKRLFPIGVTVLLSMNGEGARQCFVESQVAFLRRFSCVWGDVLQGIRNVFEVSLSLWNTKYLFYL
jgi:hypothetical protein